MNREKIRSEVQGQIQLEQNVIRREKLSVWDKIVEQTDLSGALALLDKHPDLEHVEVKWYFSVPLILRKEKAGFDSIGHYNRYTLTDPARNNKIIMEYSDFGNSNDRLDYRLRNALRGNTDDVNEKNNYITEFLTDWKIWNAFVQSLKIEEIGKYFQATDTIKLNAPLSNPLYLKRTKNDSHGFDYAITGKNNENKKVKLAIKNDGYVSGADISPLNYSQIASELKKDLTGWMAKLATQREVLNELKTIPNIENLLAENEMNAADFYNKQCGRQM